MSDNNRRIVWAHDGYLTSPNHHAAKRSLAVGAAWPIEVRTLVLAFSGPDVGRAAANCLAESAWSDRPLADRLRNQLGVWAEYEVGREISEGKHSVRSTGRFEIVDSLERLNELMGAAAPPMEG